jgi:hypothetical protein
MFSRKASDAGVTDCDVGYLASPFREFGVDSLIAEKIFSYLDGIDVHVCLGVNRVTHFVVSAMTFFGERKFGTFGFSIFSSLHKCATDTAAPRDIALKKLRPVFELTTRSSETMPKDHASKRPRLQYIDHASAGARISPFRSTL